MTKSKWPVAAGGWRLTKQVTSREQVVDEPLRHQRVEVERRAVVGMPLAIGEWPAPHQEGDPWTLSVIEEVVVTEKRWRLVEEVRVTRVDGTHRQPQTVTLRREDITIEPLPPDASLPSVMPSS